MSAGALPLVTAEALDGLRLLRSPVWVFDIDGARMAWANGEAVRMWGAASLEELLARDFSGMSEATRIRLGAYWQAFTAGETRSEQWTFYPGGAPCIVECECSGVRLPGGGIAMLVEGRVRPPGGIDQDALRMVEALRHTGVMVSLYATDGAPVIRNPAAIRAYGEAAGGAALWTLFGDPDTAARLRAALERGESVSAETPMRTAGGVHWHGLDARVTTDPATGGTAILVNEKSVDERMQAEHLLARERAALRSMIDNFPFPFWLKDLNGSLQAVNPAFVEMSGAGGADAVLGRTVFDLFPRALAEAAAADEAAVLRDRAQRTAEDEREIRGERRWYETYRAPVVDAAGHLLGTVGFARDITERRRAQDALRKASDDLARSNAELEQFAYAASHDLRQPLRTVASFLTLLEAHLAGTLDADGKEFLDFACGGARRMDRMIVDLLEYSRAGRGLRPSEPVPLADAVDEAVGNLDAVIREAGACIRVADGLPTVVAERGEMVRLFQNLIGNAVKYHAAGREPVVEIAADAGPASGGDRVAVTVRDNGIGIAAEHFERIFGVFQRLHGRDEYEGTGIGLAVCRKIAERCGGTIGVASRVGEGSAFTVTLPAPASVPAAATRAEEAA